MGTLYKPPPWYAFLPCSKPTSNEHDAPLGSWTEQDVSQYVEAKHVLYPARLQSLTSYSPDDLVTLQPQVLITSAGPRTSGRTRKGEALGVGDARGANCQRLTHGLETVNHVTTLPNCVHDPFTNQRLPREMHYLIGDT